MKHNIIILIFILSLSNYIAKAQNLVPNNYFEIKDTCPNNQFQITYAINWLNAGGTPDYFNSCSNINSGFSVPNNALDYQKDCCGGNGYVGIYVSSADGNDASREYIQIKLIDTLKAGKKYLASMYVNRSKSEGWAIATMGMFFSNAIISVPSSLNQFINIPNPQVKNTIQIKDTINWILVEDTFVANGNEKYLVIGNFSTNALSDTVKIISNGAYYFQSYYYIDGVNVFEINDSCNNYWDAGFDKSIFVGDSVRLGGIDIDSSAYNWQNSLGGTTYLSSNTDSRPWCKPMQTTTYYVTKTCPNNNVFVDTVTVYVQQNVGINQFVENNIQIRLYPNPSNGNLYVQYNFRESASLEISDLSGRLVGTYVLPATGTHTEVKNNDLHNGVYIYRVVSNGTVIKIGKIVVMQQ